MTSSHTHLVLLSVEISTQPTISPIMYRPSPQAARSVQTLCRGVFARAPQVDLYPPGTLRAVTRTALGSWP